MAGIVSYGAYIPMYRLDRKIIYKAMGWLNPATYQSGERSVANYDEDSLSMAVNAGMDCLKGIDRSTIDGAYFATTTTPYKERQSSPIIATALDLKSNIRTADFTNAAKAGTTGVLSASDTITSGGAKNIIVCASDCLVGKAGSAQEELFGDGAASLLMGDDDVIASLEGSYSVAYDFVAHWRSEDQKFDQQWEDRFIRDVGYKNFIIESISGLMKKCSLKAKDIFRVAYPCLYAGDHRGIAKKLGFDPSQVQDPMSKNVGYTGTSNPLIQLVAALEEAKAGDKIIIASFGSGSDAILFEVTDGIGKIQGNRKGVKGHLSAKRDLTNYEKMVSFRDVLPVEEGIRGKLMIDFTPQPEMYRSRKVVLGLVGSKCKKCGVPQFPAQRICVNPDCGALDQMDEYRFSDRKAKIFTYTGDSLAFSPDPPAVYAIVEFDGGGRYWFDLTDVDLESVEVGMSVEMSFRRKYVDDKFGVYGYFWKAVPVSE